MYICVHGMKYRGLNDNDRRVDIRARLPCNIPNTEATNLSFFPINQNTIFELHFLWGKRGQNGNTTGWFFAVRVTRSFSGLSLLGETVATVLIQFPVCYVAFLQKHYPSRINEFSLFNNLWTVTFTTAGKINYFKDCITILMENCTLLVYRINPSSQEDFTIHQPVWREEKRFEDLGEGCTAFNDYCWH